MAGSVEGGWLRVDGIPAARSGTNLTVLAVTAAAGVGTGAHADWDPARMSLDVSDEPAPSAAEVSPPPDEMSLVSKDVPEGEGVAVADTAEVIADDGSITFQATSTQVFDAKIIRDGRLDLRVEPGSFGSGAEQVRVIAADLGGYVASGETHIEELDDATYAVGWYTMRIPSDRFDEAVGRVEQLGERVSASLSSQDVTEEYVDLEGRLNYWRQQEGFYSALLDEVTEVSELIALQKQMREVLLTIEQIEGRTRYLDSRTDFATLTVGLTEVPGGPVSPPAEPLPVEAGTIERAFEQAGEVLLATVAFIIVAAAVGFPIGILALLVYGILRLLAPTFRRKDAPAES